MYSYQTTINNSVGIDVLLFEVKHYSKPVLSKYVVEDKVKRKASNHACVKNKEVISILCVGVNIFYQKIHPEQSIQKIPQSFQGWAFWGRARFLINNVSYKSFLSSQGPAMFCPITSSKSVFFRKRWYHYDFVYLFTNASNNVLLIHLRMIASNI